MVRVGKTSTLASLNALGLTELSGVFFYEALLC